MSEAAQREGAYRLLENEAVSPEAIGAAVFEATARRAAGLDRVIVAMDQSTLSITDRQNRKGLGRTGGRVDGFVRRGLESMTALASSREGMRLGVLGQVWHRRSESWSPVRTRDRRPFEERESGLWHRCMRVAMDTVESFAPRCRPWFQMDRGADITHVFQAVFKFDADVTIRSTHNRRLDTSVGYLHDRLRASPSLGIIRTSVGCRDTKHGRRTTRPVELSVRACRLVLRMQDNHGARFGAQPVTGVHVRERGRGRSSGIEWFLITNVEARTFEQACEVVNAYRTRWSVEDFHRAWKQGVCCVERSQLRSAAAFRRWATILAAVAARAERLKTLSRAEPERDALDEFSQDELDAVFVLTERYVKKKAPPLGSTVSLQQAVEMVAFIGGYTGRKNSGGPPGATVIGRGLDQVVAAAVAVAALRPRSG